MSKDTHDTLTKDWALDVLAERIAKKFPAADIATERAILAKRSRAVLLHAVGSQWYGELDQMDDRLMAYAYAEMTPTEQRTIDQAG